MCGLAPWEKGRRRTCSLLLQQQQRWQHCWTPVLLLLTAAGAPPAHLPEVAPQRTPPDGMLGWQTGTAVAGRAGWGRRRPVARLPCNRQAAPQPAAPRPHPPAGRCSHSKCSPGSSGPRARPCPNGQGGQPGAQRCARPAAAWRRRVPRLEAPGVTCVRLQRTAAAPCSLQQRLCPHCCCCHWVAA